MQSIQIVKGSTPHCVGLQEFYLVTNNKVVNSDAVLRRLRPGGQVGVCLGAAPPRPSLSAAPPASSLPSGAGTAAGAGSAVRSRPPAGPSRPATSTAAGPAAPHGTSERKTEASSPTGSLDYRPPAKVRFRQWLTPGHAHATNAWVGKVVTTGNVLMTGLSDSKQV